MHVRWCTDCRNGVTQLSTLLGSLTVSGSLVGALLTVYVPVHLASLGSSTAARSDDEREKSAC